MSVEKDTIINNYVVEAKVDNKMISYNDKGELQLGTNISSLSEIDPFYNPVKNISFDLESDNGSLKYSDEYYPSFIKKNIYVNRLDKESSMEESFNYEDGSFTKQFYIEDEFQSIKKYEHLGMGYQVNTEYSHKDGNISCYNMFDPEGLYSTMNIGDVSCEIIKSNGEEKDVLNESISIASKDINILKRLINKDYNHSFETDFDFDLRAKKVRVNDKDVITSINGALANEKGEIVFEEFPNGVILKSPNQSKYRVIVGDDGTLSVSKIS